MVRSPIVDSAWLKDNLERVTVADVRWYMDGRDGRDAYHAGHIPGAVFVDLDHWLSGNAPESEGRHPLPDPSEFAKGMAHLGIADDAIVIAYDDAGGVIAARLVWMLRSTGHDAALLDGGIDAWDGPLERPVPMRPGVRFRARDWPSTLVATIDDAAPEAGNIVLDARQAERYRGISEQPRLDPRAGHIPGSISVPCRENLDENGRFLPVEALRAKFAAAGIEPNGGLNPVRGEIVSSCGSGVTACHNLLAMEHAGLGRGRLFPGSWSQWSRDNSRPTAKGESPSGD